MKNIWKDKKTKKRKNSLKKNQSVEKGEKRLRKCAKMIKTNIKKSEEGWKMLEQR